MIRTQPPPSIVRDPSGTHRYAGRRVGELVGDALFCPDGQRFPRPVVRAGDNHYPLKCHHTTHALRKHSGGFVDHWLYLVPDGRGGTAVFELHADEVAWIATRKLSAPEVWTYLGEAVAA